MVYAKTGVFYHIVGRPFPFSVDICPWLVLSAIESQQFPSRNKSSNLWPQKFCFSADNRLQSISDELSSYIPILCWVFSYEILRNMNLCFAGLSILKVLERQSRSYAENSSLSSSEPGGRSSIKTARVATSPFCDEQSLPSAK